MNSHTHRPLTRCPYTRQPPSSHHTWLRGPAFLAASLALLGCITDEPLDDAEHADHAPTPDLVENAGPTTTPQPPMSGFLRHPGHTAEGTLGTTVDPKYGLRLYESNFNGNANDWRLWQWRGANAKAGFVWHDDPPAVRAYQNGALWFTNMASPGDYDVGQREVSWAISPTFTLKGKGNLLWFKSSELTDGTSKDKRIVYIHRAGIGWTAITKSQLQLEADRNGVVGDRWVYISLDPYASDTPTNARIGFAFDTVNGVDNKHLGWVIDGVRIARQDVPIIDWEDVGSLAGVPAIGSLDQRIHMAAVRDSDGRLVTTYTDTSGDFSPVELLLPGATFDRDIPPQIVNVGDQLVLLAAPEAGMPQAWRRKATDPTWTWLGAVGTGGDAAGRMSVATTGTDEIHLAFRLATGSASRLMHLRLQPGYLEVEKSSDIHHPTSVGPALTVASDGNDELLVLRPTQYNKRFWVYTAARSANWALAYKGTSQYEAATSASAVHHQGRFFFYYGDTAGNLRGQQLRPDGYIRNEPVPANTHTGMEPLALLLHHAIVVVHEANDGELHYIRREKMAGKDGIAVLAEHPYHKGGSVGDGVRPLSPAAPPSVAAIGDELFISAGSYSTTNGSSASGSTEMTTRWLTMSRSIFKKRLEEIGMPIVGYNEFNDYDKHIGYPDLQIEPWRLALTTRLGQASWNLPAWLVDDFFIELTATKEGQPAPGNPLSGKSGPCRVLLTSVSHTPNYAPDGVRLHVNHSTYQAWEEWGHWMYNALVAANLGDVSRFSEQALDEANTLTKNPSPLPACVDGTTSGACASDRRRGFFGRYESPSAGSGPSKGHSWIYTVIPYARYGATYRARAAADAAKGVDLLDEKYEWAKTYVFGGTEFGDGWVPLAP